MRSPSRRNRSILSISLRRVAFLLALLCSAAASADSWPRAELPLKLARDLVVEGVSPDKGDKGDKKVQPVVRRGALSAPLARQELRAVYLSPKSDRIELLLETDWYFGEPLTTTFSLDMLEARLENAAALKLHRNKRYAEAAQGFTRALRLDPRFRLAAYNLASALSQQGRKDEAVAALAPFLSRELPATYLALLQDPELQPLLETREVAALRADSAGTVGTAGTAALTARDERWLAHSARHQLLAALDPHRGLVLFSLRTGEVVAQLEMGTEIFPWSCDGCSDEIEQQARRAKASAQVAFQKKLPLANRFLAELGFSALKRREDGKRCEPGRSLCFAASGLRVEFSDDEDRATVYKKGQRVTAPSAEYCSHSIDGGTYLPELQVVTYRWSHRHGSTDRGRQQGTELLLVSPSASKNRPPPRRCAISEQAYSCDGP